MGGSVLKEGRRRRLQTKKTMNIEQEISRKQEEECFRRAAHTYDQRQGLTAKLNDGKNERGNSTHPLLFMMALAGGGGTEPCLNAVRKEKVSVV